MLPRLTIGFIVLSAAIVDRRVQFVWQRQRQRRAEFPADDAVCEPTATRTP